MARASTFVIALAFAVVAGRSQSAAAQQALRGQITGVIVDESGKPLSDVCVTAHGAEQVQLMKTDASGEFRLHDLVPGRYVLTVAHDGFTTIVHSGMMVRSGKVAHLPLVLKVAPDWARPIAEAADPFALLPADSHAPAGLVASNAR